MSKFLAPILEIPENSPREIGNPGNSPRILGNPGQEIRIPGFPGKCLDNLFVLPTSALGKTEKVALHFGLYDSGRVYFLQKTKNYNKKQKNS